MNCRIFKRAMSEKMWIRHFGNCSDDKIYVFLYLMSLIFDHDAICVLHPETQILMLFFIDDTSHV